MRQLPGLACQPVRDFGSLSQRCRDEGVATTGWRHLRFRTKKLSAGIMTQFGNGPIARFLQLIRFSHTIFALPFALGALIVAANGCPSLRIFLLVIVCMVFARTAAMLFNRLVDWSLDQRNPRTASRHLLASKLSAVILLILSCAGFLLAASAINRLTCILAPVALALIFFYSVTKRFTSATHFFLGLALAIAPVGAWIAQTGHLDIAPIVLAAGVICWVAGFDLIYATQDYDFDRREGIRSLVVKLGIMRSLRLAQLLHLLTFVALIAFGFVAKLGALYYWSLPMIAAALVYEHKTEKRDLAGINRAFFQSNAFVSAVFLLAVCIDRLT
jgi:4-hydroxybenzoate polyprenyltransferase